MCIVPYDKCEKIMLHKGVVREQFVGVDAHIDPRSEENKSGLPCRGAVSAAD